jgi:PAS domain S-box-containing protein
MGEERTDRIQKPDSGKSGANEILRQLNQRINDLIELLRSQREMLQQRGMTLPSGSLDTLRSLKVRLDALQRMTAATQIELSQLRILADSTALINSTLDTHAALEQIMDTVIQLTGAERGYIVLRNHETGELEFRVARGIDKEQLSRPEMTSSTGTRSELIISRGIVNRVAESGEPIVTDNASEDTRFSGSESIMGYQLRSILAVPLKVRDEVIGVVYCDNRVVKALFQRHELDLLTAFANQAAVAIENAQLFEAARAQLAQLVEMRDLLNNIFNSIVSGVITIDTTGTIISANDAAHAILGVEQALAYPLEKVFPPMEDAFYDMLAQVLEDGQTQLLEVKVILHGQLPRWWNVIVSALRDEDGTRQGVAMVIDDLTEQKEREATLKAVGVYMSSQLLENIRDLEAVNTSGEEREITAVFADVRGFTKFSENLEPEVLMEIINKYLTVASDAIIFYDGLVDKYMGDAVTGLFNTQLNPQDDHPLRGVRAAMNIIYDLINGLHEVVPEDQRLFYGIGVHTGPSFLGRLGSPERREFSAIGEAMTMCKVLQGFAGPGEVIISAQTHAYIKDLFECEERAPTPDLIPKGIDLPVIYRIVKRKRGTSTGLLTLDPELADLIKGTSE